MAIFGLRAAGRLRGFSISAFGTKKFPVSPEKFPVMAEQIPCYLGAYVKDKPLKAEAQWQFWERVDPPISKKFPVFPGF